MDTAPFLHSTVDPTRLLADPVEELKPILCTLDGWDDADDLEVSQISGAMTNLIYRCENVDKEEFVLARVFGGNDDLFDRRVEQRIFTAVGRAGLGPRLLVSFENGRLEEFLLDQSIDAVTMRSTPIAACVAAAMARFHFSPLAQDMDISPSGSEPIIWRRLRAWAEKVQELFAPPELVAWSLATVSTQIDALEAKLSVEPTLIGFCHNDLQYGNMLLHTASPRALSRCSSLASAASPRGASPPPRGRSPEGRQAGSLRGSSPAGRQGGLRGASPPKGSWPSWGAACGGSPPSSAPRRLQRGFSWLELEDRLESGETVTELLARASRDFAESGGAGLEPHGMAIPGAGEGRGGDADVLATQQLAVRLLDFEYAGPNPVALDIVNHMCEYAADYHSDAPHRLDFSLFPSPAQQAAFLRTYLRIAARQQAAPAQARGGGGVGQVAALRRAVRAYLPVCHLQWGLWGLIQSRVSSVPGFDFLEYARQRLDQYFLTIPDVLEPGPPANPSAPAVP